MGKIVKKLINYALIVALAVGSVAIGPLSNTVEVHAISNSLSGYKISGYPKFPQVSQENYIIYKEGFRSDRIEICFYNIQNETSESFLRWNENGSLDVVNGYIANDEKYFLSDDNQWVKFESGYGRVSDYASDIMVSSRNVLDCNEKIAVKATPIRYIKFTRSKWTLTKGDRITLKYKTNIKEKVSFSSSKKNIVSVNSKGQIKAKKVGKATITAKVASGKKATCKITVTD